MAISREHRRHLESGDFDQIEDVWLQRAGESPEDTDFFVGIARALVGIGEADRARFLIDLLDDQLRERELWDDRLALLRRLGPLDLDPRWVHEEMMVTVRRLFADCTILDDLIEEVGLERAVEDLPKGWKKVDRLTELVTFDVGSVVEMKGKGVGRIVECNMALKSLRVQVGRSAPISVGFRAVPKMLRVLPPGHFLRRKLEEPDELKRLAKEDPPQLLGAVLESSDSAMMAGEIRTALAGVIDAKRWNSWWASARRHPQVLSHGGPRSRYSWVATAEGAVDAVWLDFENGDLDRKLELLRREGGRDAALLDRMAERLVELGQHVATKRPMRAIEIWFALEREKALPEGLPWSPAELARQAGNPASLAAGLTDRQHRSRFYATLIEADLADSDVLDRILRQETDTKLLAGLTKELAAASEETYERFLSDVLSRPQRLPAAFTWLVEAAAEDDVLRTKSPARLFQQILKSLTWDELIPYRDRLRRMTESGGTLPRLLTDLSPGDARKAEHAIQKATALEDYDRRPLLNALHLRFPDLAQETAQPLYATPESISERRAEFERMREVDIPANRKAIEEAREMGDLRENFEYKAARQRHEYLSSRVANLHNELERARPLQADQIDTTSVRIGCKVRLTSDDSDWVLTILGPWESRPEDDIVSYESQIGKQLLGKEQGDLVNLAGTEYRVASIEAYR